MSADQSLHSASGGIVELRHASNECDGDAKALLNEAIEALPATAAMTERIGEATAWLAQLESGYTGVDQELVCVVRSITNDLEHRMIDRDQGMSPQDELELSQRLLSVYLDASEGALIW